MATIELIDLTKHYKQGSTVVKALDGVNLTIESGEFVSIVGRSGSGKTTALDLLGLLLRPTSGQVMLDGTDTGKLRDGARADLRGQKLGFVFQECHDLTAIHVQFFDVGRGHAGLHPLLISANAGGLVDQFMGRTGDPARCTVYRVALGHVCELATIAPHDRNIGSVSMLYHARYPVFRRVGVQLADAEISGMKQSLLLGRLVAEGKHASHVIGGQ